jgi:SPP1 family predicted phage head-tail adaptor
MQAGDFDTQACIERDTSEPDAHGNHSPEWSYIGESWAKIEDKSGRELYRAQQIEAQISAIVYLREKLDAKPKDRLRIVDGYGKDRTFAISSVMGTSDRNPSVGLTLAVIERIE